MKKILLSLSLLFAAALAPVGTATKKKALPPMKEFVGQLISRMTLQENIDVWNWKNGHLKRDFLGKILPKYSE